MAWHQLLYGSLRAGSRGKGKIIFAIALSSAVCTFIATPRPTRPHVIPLPRFDMTTLRATEALEIQRARSVQGGELSFKTRAVGEQLRRVGLSIYQRTHIDREALLRLRKDAKERADGPSQNELLDLRALQSELFLEAVRDSLMQRSPNQDLKELGGEFPRFLFSVWLDERGDCIFDQDTLRLMFRAHFNQLTGLSSHRAFEFSLEETRRYYGNLIEFPPVQFSASLELAQKRFAYARALGRSDPQFESRALEGMLQLQMGRPGHAVKLFNAYLQAKPNGPFSHVVRGHLEQALALAAAAVQGQQ